MENLKETLKEYYNAKQVLAGMAERVKELEKHVTDLLVEEGGKAEIEEAKFSIVQSVVYKYTKAVVSEEDKLKEEEDKFKQRLTIKKDIVKALKETEVATGKAVKVSESFSTRMTLIKDKDATNK